MSGEKKINLAKKYYDLNVQIFKELKEHEMAGEFNEKKKKLMIEFEEKLSEIKKVVDSGDHVRCIIMVFENDEQWRTQWIKRFREA